MQLINICTSSLFGSQQVLITLPSIC